MQLSFFDTEDRLKKLNEHDPLMALDELVDWELFRDTLSKIREKTRKSTAGRKPFDEVVMFKALILQHLYNLSDEGLEFQIRDRNTFCRFLNLMPPAKTPDAKTLWLFREHLIKKSLIKTLFEDFEFQLQERGFKARKGQIVDASFVEAPKQRNTKEQNKVIKAGGVPEEFNQNPHVKCQKDVDARWAKKHDETHYGYKNHISIDTENKLIRDYQVTSANVHDSQVLDDVLSENQSKAIWADSAYRSDEQELELYASGYRSYINHKGHRNKPLTKTQQVTNKKRSSVRARVEHIFGSITNEQGGLLIRVIGLARATAKVGLMNLTYNLRRLVTLTKIRASIQ